MQGDAEQPVPTVLPSSTELFYFYSQTLEQCGKYTVGEPMWKLAKVFAKWLKIFSGAPHSYRFTKDLTDIAVQMMCYLRE